MHSPESTNYHQHNKTMNLRPYQYTSFQTQPQPQQQNFKSFGDSTWNNSPLTKLKHTLHSGWPTYAKGCDLELKGFWSYHKEISLEDGILFKGHWLIVPRSERQSIPEILHTGHYRIDKMTLGVRESVFWAGISNDIRTLTESSAVCQENSKPLQKETQ